MNIDIPILFAIIKGMATYLPGMNAKINRKREHQKHSGSIAEFCYTLWLSLLSNLVENEIDYNFERFGELGNGRSLGIAFCALLTGTKQYVSLEIEGTYTIKENLKLLDNIVLLFRKKANIINKYKQLNIKITDNSIKKRILNTLVVNETRVSEIKKEIINNFKDSKLIQIIKPWEQSSPLGLDIVFSRAVMEHVNEPHLVYQSLTKHLKKDAIMFHDIEFHSHNITKNPNGHYKIPNLIWKLICGKREYYLNKWTLKEHLQSIRDNQFQIKDIRSNFHDKYLIGATVLSKKN
jgi:hypothetical protein